MDTSEKGLETIIVDWLRDQNGYEQLTTKDYDKDYALVEKWLVRFLTETQPDRVARTMCFASPSEKRKFFTRLRDQITKDGISSLLRKGFKYNGGETFDMYYPLPSELNESAKVAYGKNIFGVIRQLKYSKKNENAIDFVIFMNGLPFATFELKNEFTNQTVDNAIEQYKKDRKPDGEILLQKKRCAVHMAVDDEQVFMCTELKGKDSWFLPFNRGVNGGAGNPVIHGKTMTSYLWEDILTKPSLSDIIENFAQVTHKTVRKKVNGKWKEETKEQTIWPRYHQLDCVHQLLHDTQKHEVGRRYLIQHSAGSGKSNSISWLAYQLVMLMQNHQPMFDSVIVVTDRVNLDKQIRDNINSFKKLKDIVGWADDSSTLRDLLTGGKSIIVSTVFKFKFILDEIGTKLKDKKFAIIIDEAHSSQSGKAASSVAIAVSGNGTEKNEDGEPEDTEDKIHRIIKGRKMAKNANYYAFTATPKNKTLKMFGTPMTTADGVTIHEPFHEYTMKQAIEEDFIKDVLRNYTPYSSYYKVVKTVEDDPEFDKKKAMGKIRTYIEAQPETIEAKAKIMVDHFCTHVYKKMKGKARAMVVTSSIERAIEFYDVITRMLKERNSPYRAIVAFSEKVINGKKVTEADKNGFPSADIEDKIAEDPYRILVVADKFQTGYDQPLLHTMYVDKMLCDVKAVQTLSRLNRCHPDKQDTFVLDFCNDPEAIRLAFQKYYKTTLLEGESDVNKLNDLTDIIEDCNFYTEEDVNNVIELWAKGKDEDRQKLDSIFDGIRERFKTELNDEAKIKAKSAIKNYCRSYPFFAAIMPFESVEWERLYVFYSLLLTKLPKLKLEDFAKGIIETIDFNKYRIVKEEERKIELEDKDTSIAPVPVGTVGGGHNPELDVLSNIIQDFNDTFGNIEWKNEDEVKHQIQELPTRLAGSEDFINALRNGDAHAAQIAFHDAITEAVARMLEEKTEFVEHYFNNEDFRNFINNRVFYATRDMVEDDAQRPIISVGGTYIENQTIRFKKQI